MRRGISIMTGKSGIPVKNARYTIGESLADLAGSPDKNESAQTPESSEVLEAKLEMDVPAPRAVRVYVETYGCQMNEYDSGLVGSLLGKKGFQSVTKPEDAGVILLNTCAVRENAHQKVYGRLQSFSGLKRKHKELVIGILGCMAQNLGDDLFAMGLPVDMIVGPDNYRNLPELIEKIRKSEERAVQLTRLSLQETYEELEPVVLRGRQAFVTIMRGCDNFCSFCVVPYTRGRERSRSPESVVTEVNNLVKEQGVKEVTLLGQNVNSYIYKTKRSDKDGFDFTALVDKLLQETEIERIRFTSPHPHDFPVPLLELMAKHKRFCSYIHLPVQSGSSKVLGDMKRDYNREEFLELVKRIRKIVGPDVGLSTDVIVGFPGESEADFEQTLSLMDEVEFDMAFMFRYSERELTDAKKKFPDDVPEEVKLARLQKLIDTQTAISARRNTRLKGEVYQVLVEGLSKRSRDELMGRALNNKVVIFPIPEAFKENPDALFGREMEVEISSSSSATLRGTATVPSVD